MAILDLQDLEVPQTVTRSSTKSNNRCTGVGNGNGGRGGPSRLSLLLC